uniref:Major facilitator superfamily (MFS) profile domain-containing protein n=1 Tax=Cuerna arida TaxID=1464854 RepID=A0A1B6EHF6_9HEMI
MPQVKGSMLETQALLSSDHTILSHSKKWPQHMAALLASLISMATGTVAGWSSPAIPFLQGNMGTLVSEPITDEQASWVGSIVTLGCLVGAIPAGTLSQMLGRRNFLLVLALPLILGWVLIIEGEHNVQLIYLGRFINGLSFGAVTVAVPLYNNEIAEDSVRGNIGVYLDLMLCVGILWSYVVGAVSSYFWLSVSCCMIPIVFLLTFFWMPESPVHLMAQGKIEDAEMALRWLRGAKPYHQYDTEPEMLKIQNMVDQAKERAQTAVDISDFSSIKEKLSSLSLRSTTSKAIAIALGLMTFQRLSGVSAVVYYTVDIFRGAGTSIPPTTATIIVGVVSVIASAASACLVDRVGRRFLLIMSDAIMAISLAVMGIYFVYKDSDENAMIPAMRAIIPVIALSAHTFAFRIGLGCVPWFMVPELIPMKDQAWANSLANFYSYIALFIVLYSFIWGVNVFGYSVTFFFFSVVCLIGTLFIYSYVPETKCKSKEQIQRELKYGIGQVRYGGF